MTGFEKSPPGIYEQIKLRANSTGRGNGRSPGLEMSSSPQNLKIWYVSKFPAVVICLFTSGRLHDQPRVTAFAD